MRALFVLVALNVAALAAEQIPAFPGADGAGMYASGGRGGTVYRVTNLNAEGPGSLADAVSEPNRIIVFAVSGIIDLTRSKGDRLRSGKITVEQPNITIAGQSAPGEGICLKGGALEISASNVIVRYLRSRRGFVSESDTGDAFEVKPRGAGPAQDAIGRTDEVFEKTKIKKESRGKVLQQPGMLDRIMLDHLSASWATDENLTLTHANLSTMQYCIAAEGLDYANPKQTPPNHSEGSLWGSAAPDGRSTLHHSIYAHNRLRNPRSTGGAMPPPVLTFYNNIVYDWSEYPSHTGSEAVLLNWLNNRYIPGPSTPQEIAGHMFEFHGDPRARIYASGNVVEQFAAGTEDNSRAIFFGLKLRKLNDAEKAEMIVGKPFGEVLVTLQTAEEARETVLREAGATLPARDPVDVRIVRSILRTNGRVIERETDLPEHERWPEYHSLPAPADSDQDGVPDFWELQFGLNPTDPTDSPKIAAGGYANIEHYLNNTAPNGDAVPIVYISAPVSRATPGQPGMWRVTRTGPVDRELHVQFAVEKAKGAAGLGLQGVDIPAGQASAELALPSESSVPMGSTFTKKIGPGAGYHIGCPSSALIVADE